MPRKNLIRCHEYYYHITTRSNHKEWFRLPLEEVWAISMEAFDKAQSNSPAIISQFVLMANHYHMLIRTPESNVDQFMYFFNKTFSDELRKQTNTSNRMFGSNYKWSLITNDKYFKNVFNYIYQNPLRAGVANRSEYYPYSTLFYTSKDLKLPFLFTPLDHLEGDHESINHCFDRATEDSIRKGLMRTEFKEIKVRGY